MTARRRVKIIAACIGAAVAQWCAGTAHADSAVGVDTALGNALNPPGRSAVPRPLADDGFDTVRHSPSGQLYGIPIDRSDEGANKTEGGWTYSGGVDFGALGDDASKKSALFRKYKDLKNGPYLDYFEVEGDKNDTAAYVQAFGGGAGRHDQFYGFQFGHYNDWKVRLFYNETQHVFTDTWKSLYNGEGTGNLTIKTGQATPVTSGTLAGQSAALGLTAFGAAGNCTTTAPCWAYNGKLYSNAAATGGALAGFTGTYGGAAGTTLLNSTQSGIAAQIANTLAATNESELSLVRKKGGARFDATIDNYWKGYASYTQEERKGARPFAMNENNISTEIAEPIDYTSQDFLAGIQYADGRTQANLRATLSMFRNNISTLNVQYPIPGVFTGNGAVQTATYDLYPNNKAFNLKGEFARDLPDFYHGRFNANVSWGTNRQDDSLLPPISDAQNANLAAAGIATLNPTTNAGYNPALGVFSVPVSNWNTTAALSQQTAKQRIDNKLIDLGLSIKPLEDLMVKGNLRRFETVNKGGYIAYNPLTGQFGRGFADGNGLGVLDAVVGLAPGATINTAGSCYIPLGYPPVPGCTFGVGGTNVATNNVATGANVPVFGQARSTKQTNYTLTADYDLTSNRSVNASIEREDFKRNFREREKTWENKLKVGYVDRALGDITLRTSLEADYKRGGDYRFRTFEDLGTGLPGLDPATQVAMQNTQRYPALAVGLFNRYSYYFRKYDQADRNQDIFNARVNYLARDDLDMGVALQLKRADYPNSFYGLEKDNLDSLTLDLNYQPVTGSSFYAYYTFQQGRKIQNLNSGVASATNTCTVANLALYGYSACSDNVNGVGGPRPLSDAWTSTNDDFNHILGLGFQGDIGAHRFSVDYTYMSSTTNIGYQFGPTAFSQTAATQATLAAIAGTALPSMKFDQHTFNFNYLIPIDKRLSVRLFDRLEIGKVKDWHYDSVITGQVLNVENGTLMLDSGPQSYRANVIGVFLQYKL